MGARGKRLYPRDINNSLPNDNDGQLSEQSPNAGALYYIKIPSRQYKKLFKKQKRSLRYFNDIFFCKSPSAVVISVWKYCTKIIGRSHKSLWDRLIFIIKLAVFGNRVFMLKRGPAMCTKCSPGMCHACINTMINVKTPSYQNMHLQEKEKTLVIYNEDPYTRKDDSYIDDIETWPCPP